MQSNHLLFVSWVIFQFVNFFFSSDLKFFMILPLECEDELSFVRCDNILEIMCIFDRPNKIIVKIKCRIIVNQTNRSDNHF